jgi:hypothetical protein
MHPGMAWFSSQRTLALSLLVLGPACGPLIIDIESDSEAESVGEPESETTSPTTVSTSSTTSPPSTSTTTTATTTSATTVPDTTTVDPTGNEPGFCAQACEIAADCVFQGGIPEDFACTDGFCEYIGEIPACEPATCDDLMIGVCSEVDGVSQCTTPCANDSQCLAGFTTCTGVDDAGNSICEPIPCWGTPEGEACFIEGFGQIGVCIDGLCACTDDSQCTADGFGCNA